MFLFLINWQYKQLRDKRNLKILQFCPVSLGAMLEYWYIERGLLPARFIIITRAFIRPGSIIGPKDKVFRPRP